MANHRLERLPLGATRPTGWVGHQMVRDFESGFVGHLDRLVPALFEDDIYGRDRLTSDVTAKDVGAVQEPRGDAQVQHLWWNSETQSNWRDGWLRHVLLVGGERGRTAAEAYVDRILGTQDEDGYLGIYAPDLRYRCSGENGELWSQATLLRGLLAWFDATGDERVLNAAVRAVNCTRRAWPLPESRPFERQGGSAGNAHGLMFVDVLERLSEVTGDASFRDYAVLLYESYSRSTVSEPDCQLAHLGRLYRLRPSGQLDLLLANVPSPNGVALSPDERVLYLAVTRGNQVWRVPLMDDGSVSKAGALFTSYGPSGPDGLAVDTAGRVVVANLGLGVAWVLSQRAEPEVVLRSSAGASLTNLAFGGSLRQTVYCTESVSGSILRAELDQPGLPIHRPPAFDG